jgi:nitrite reductase (NADH) small subunit/3-phenylpropionate/trans-cinnamate dioxygenase ferredoxin subunit
MFVKVAKVSDLSNGDSLCAEVAGNQIALFNLNGEFYAIDNSCPHRGGPLSEGLVDPARMTVQCPWHGWVFNCASGESPIIPGARVQKFEVKVEGDEIYVEID